MSAKKVYLPCGSTSMDVPHPYVCEVGLVSSVGYEMFGPSYVCYVKQV